MRTHLICSHCGGIIWYENQWLRLEVYVGGLMLNSLALHDFCVPKAAPKPAYRDNGARELAAVHMEGK